MSAAKTVLIAVHDEATQNAADICTNRMRFTHEVNIPKNEEDRLLYSRIIGGKIGDVK